MVSYLTLLPLPKDFLSIVHSISMLLCITLAEVLVIFTDADMRIKDIQIGDHKIKTAKFADDAAIFLRDFICLTKMKLILELGGKASSSKLNFSKSQTLWSVAYKIELINQDKWLGHNSVSK